MSAIREVRGTRCRIRKILKPQLDNGILTPEEAVSFEEDQINRQAQVIYENNLKLTPEQIEQRRNAPAKVPVWPDVVRGVPNVFLRSALFGVNKENKPALDNADIYSSSLYKINYTGASLKQSDLDIWQSIMQMLRGKEWGTIVEFSAWEILDLLDKSHSGPKMNEIAERLALFKTSSLEITDTKTGRLMYKGPLIKMFKMEDNPGRHKKYYVAIDPGMKELYRYDQYTYLNWNIRKALKNKPIAKWMHAFYSTHASVFPLTLGFMSKLCGYSPANDFKLKQNLIESLACLANVCTIHNQYLSYSVIDKREVEDKKTGEQLFKHVPVKKQKLIIEKEGSESQQNHIWMRKQEKMEKAKLDQIGDEPKNLDRFDGPADEMFLASYELNWDREPQESWCLECEPDYES